MVLVPPHQIEVGRGQHGERHTGIRHAPGAFFKQRRWCGGKLCHMADRDTAAVFVLVGLLADIEQVKVVRGGSEIEMHVDVDVELARYLENAIDLTVWA